MDENLRQQLEKELGWLPMPNRVGADIALNLLRIPEAQIAVTYGRLARGLNCDTYSGSI